MPHPISDLAGVQKPKYFLPVFPVSRLLIKAEVKRWLIWRFAPSSVGFCKRWEAARRARFATPPAQKVSKTFFFSFPRSNWKQVTPFRAPSPGEGGDSISITLANLTPLTVDVMEWAPGEAEPRRAARMEAPSARSRCRSNAKIEAKSIPRKSPCIICPLHLSLSLKWGYKFQKESTRQKLSYEPTYSPLKPPSFTQCGVCSMRFIQATVGGDFCLPTVFFSFLKTYFTPLL